MKTALIAGATGLVGSELLNLIINDPGYQKIHLLLRKKIDVNSSKLIQHVIDFEELEKFEINEPINDVFCTLGTTIKKAKTKKNFRKVDYDYIITLGNKAKEWNADRFMVVSSLGANARSSIFYNRVKGEMEKALEALKLKQLFIFRPSLLMGNRQEQRAGEKTAIAVYKVINPLFVGKLKKHKGIQAKQVANAIIKVALKNNESFKIFESDEIQNL